MRTKSKILPLRRVYPGVGRIRRSSGTRRPDILADIIATLDRLHAEGNLKLLEAIRDGALKPINVFYHRVEHAEDHKVPERYIYAIQAQPSGNIKIGIATSPRKRLKDLQVTSWETLAILYTTNGQHEDERRLHRRFRAHHIAREWFRPGPEIMEWIASGLEAQAG